MGSLVGESLAHRGVLSNDMNVNHHRLVLEGYWSTFARLFARYFHVEHFEFDPMDKPSIKLQQKIYIYKQQ